MAPKQLWMRPSLVRVWGIQGGGAAKDTAVLGKVEDFLCPDGCTRPFVAWNKNQNWVLKGAGGPDAKKGHFAHTSVMEEILSEFYKVAAVAGEDFGRSGGWRRGGGFR